LITAAEKRGRLEDAWDKCTGNLRAYLRKQEQAARASISGGALASVAANGHKYDFQPYGPGQITPLEVCELLRWLIDQYDISYTFLNSCAQYGLDPFTVAFTAWPVQPMPPAQTAVILDSTGRFAIEASKYGIDANEIVGAAVSGKAIFVWMMYFTVAVTELHSDYSSLRIAAGAQFT
jgi:hypothetical protein